MKNNKLREVIAKDMTKKVEGEYRKAKECCAWDGYTPEIYEVFFKDNFHLLVTFKNGTIKDIDAQVFMNDERLKSYFDELRDNIELFQNPEIVSHVGIIWTDMADISAKGLWEWGTTIGNKKVAIKKIAFPIIKRFPNHVTLENLSDEKVHENTPHFHIFKNREFMGEVIVGDTIKELKDKKHYVDKHFKDVKKMQEYVNNNAKLLTEIYKAQDGDKKKELAKQLPDTYK